MLDQYFQLVSPNVTVLPSSIKTISCWPDYIEIEMECSGNCQLFVSFQLHQPFLFGDSSSVDVSTAHRVVGLQFLKVCFLKL